MHFNSLFARTFFFCGALFASASAVSFAHAAGGCPPGMIPYGTSNGPSGGPDLSTCGPDPNADPGDGETSNRPQGSYTSPGWDVIINGMKQANHPPHRPTLGEKLGLPPITHSGWMALASDMISVSGQTQGKRSQNEAVMGAIAQCQAKGGRGCKVITSQFIQAVPAAGVR